MTLNRFTLIALFSLTLTACDAAVETFVRDEKPPVDGRTPQAEPTTPVSTGPMLLQFSAGGGASSAAGLSMRARTNTTERAVQMGADRKAVISVGRTRVAF